MDSFVSTFHREGDVFGDIAGAAAGGRRFFPSVVTAVATDAVNDVTFGEPPVAQRGAVERVRGRLLKITWDEFGEAVWQPVIRQAKAFERQGHGADSDMGDSFGFLNEGTGQRGQEQPGKNVMSASNAGFDGSVHVGCGEAPRRAEACKGEVGAHYPAIEPKIAFEKTRETEQEWLGPGQRGPRRRVQAVLPALIHAVQLCPGHVKIRD